MKKTIVLVDGYQRSGTTLVQRIFDAHQDIFTLPYEDGLVRAVNYFRRRMGRQYPGEEYLDEMLRKADHPELLRFFLPQTMHYTYVDSVRRREVDIRQNGEDYTVDIDFSKFGQAFDEEVLSYSTMTFYDLIFAYCKSVSICMGCLESFNNAKCILLKTPRSTYALEYFFNNIDTGYVVYVARDVRAVYASMMGLKPKEFRESLLEMVPPEIGLRWERDLILAKELQKRYPDRMTIVRFEEFVEDHMAHYRRLCANIGVACDREEVSPTLQGKKWHGWSSFESSSGGIDKRAIDRHVAMYDDDIYGLSVCYLRKSIMDSFCNNTAEKWFVALFKGRPVSVKWKLLCCVARAFALRVLTVPFAVSDRLALFFRKYYYA